MRISNAPRRKYNAVTESCECVHSVTGSRVTWLRSPWRILASRVLLLFQMSEAEVNGQFESVCESVFSEVESQAMDALDLPGCFRTRSHSYLRAIQAGYSQDDECIPVMTPANMTSTVRSTAGKQNALFSPT